MLLWPRTRGGVKGLLGFGNDWTWLTTSEVEGRVDRFRRPRDLGRHDGFSMAKFPLLPPRRRATLPGSVP